MAYLRPNEMDEENKALRCHLNSYSEIEGTYLKTRLDPLGMQIAKIHVSNITILRLSGQNLREIPDDINHLDSITEVDLSNNRLRCLPDSFSSLRKLRVFNLSHNRLTDVPICFYHGMHLIKYLDLSYNLIRIFNAVPLCLSLLKLLKLNNNLLISPPVWLFYDIPTCLYFLDLSGNKKLCSKYNDYSVSETNCVSNNIKYLKVINCRLSECHMAFINTFKKVIRLELGSDYYEDFWGIKDSGNSNSFQEFPLHMLNLTESLTELYILHTSLPGIDNSISKFLKLKVLNISHNNINWLPTTISELKNLLVLAATKCGLYYLPPEFGNLTSLREVYLEENELSSLPESFSKLNNLEVLDLYSNNLATAPDVSAMTKLKAFDMCHNNFDIPESLEINGLPYSELRECLGQLLPSVAYRSVNKREECLEEKSDSSFSDEYEESSTWQYSYELAEMIMKNGDSDHDENWDDKESPDDDSDPKRLECRRLSSSNESLCAIPQDIRESKHLFCPYKEQPHF